MRGENNCTNACSMEMEYSSLKCTHDRIEVSLKHYSDRLFESTVLTFSESLKKSLLLLERRIYNLIYVE